MTEFIQTIVGQASQNSIIELIAVLLGIAYLLLAMKENIWCWYAAFFSTSIFLWVFWHVDLYMESGLQVFYLVMAVYGWYQWKLSPGAKSDDPDKTSSLLITTWRPQTHLIVVTSIIILSLASGYALDKWTQAQLSYLDSFTTWGAIATTYMVAKKVLENWIYWFVIDAVSIYLYLDRELYFTALLFFAYTIIVIFGYVTWSRRYSKQT